MDATAIEMHITVEAERHNAIRFDTTASPVDMQVAHPQSRAACDKKSEETEIDAVSHHRLVESVRFNGTRFDTHDLTENFDEILAQAGFPDRLTAQPHSPRTPPLS